MSFLYPLWLLAGLAGAGLVILLHTLRRREHVVPSVILWRRLGSGERKRQTLRPPRFNLPLILQILIVLAAGAALAQPVSGQVPATRQTVFVLDASASMRATDVAPSRFEAAKSALIGRLESYAGGAERFSVILAQGEGEYVAVHQSEFEPFRARLESLPVTDTAPDWAAVNGRVAALLRPDEAAHVVLLTDGSDIGAEVLAAGAPDEAVERIVFGETGANASLSASVTPVDLDAGRWLIEGEVQLLRGAELPRVLVRFRPQGGDTFLNWPAPTLSTASIESGRGVGRVRFTHEIELPRAAGLLRVSITGDVANYDGQRDFVLNAGPRNLQVLYIGDGNAPLQAALQALEGVAVSTAQGLPANVDEFDLVVADRAILPVMPATNMLWLGPAHLESEPAPGRLESAQPSGWESEHPLSQGVEWSLLGAQPAYRFALQAGAEVLFESGGVPLVSARSVAAGREVRVALDLESSDWVTLPGFPVFMRNLLGWVAPGRGSAVAPACVAGEFCAVDARLARLAVLDETGAVAALPLDLAVLPRGAGEGFVPKTAGVYEVGTRQIAVSSPLSESQIEPVLTATAVALTAQPVLIPLWRYALALVLALLLIEAVIAGRGSDRFLTRDGLDARIPGGERRRAILGLRVAALAAAVLAILFVPVPSFEPRDEIVVVASPEAGKARFAGTCAEGRFVALDSMPRLAGGPDCSEGAAATGADLEGSLRLAQAMLRPDRPGRIAVEGESRETVGRMAQALPELIAGGVAVDVAPVARQIVPDASIVRVEAPAHVAEGDAFSLASLIASTVTTPAHLSVTADGEVIAEQEVVLSTGLNRLDTNIPEAAGTKRFDVHVRAATDAVPDNDTAGVIVTASPRPRIAIVTTENDWAQVLVRSLEIQGMDSTVVRPSSAPFYIENWLTYDGVILLNVPAIDLMIKQQDLLEDYVADHGRAVLILGGENTFGPGGYYQTPLEEISPLSSRVPDDLPIAAFVFVIDRSGSMQADVEGVSIEGFNRLDLAKQATLSAVELLNPESRPSIVAFDSLAQVVVPIQPRKDEAAISRALRLLDPGGGTSIYPGLVEAINQLSTVESSIRHVVVMSDGLSEPGEFEPLIAQARAMGITISSVAIGDSADPTLLAYIARLGGGAFHSSADFRALPSILAQEALMLSAEPMEMGERQVHWVDRSGSYFDELPDEMPDIGGYVRTTLKPEADLHLAITQDDGEEAPLLASWRYGNGFVMAFAAHGAGPSSIGWLDMPMFPALWSEPLRHFAGGVQGPGLHLALSRDGDAISIVADAVDTGGEPISGLSPVATVTALDGSSQSVALRQTAPGRYAGESGSRIPGLYSVSVAADEGTTASAAFILPYAALMDINRPNSGLLPTLAAATGGRVFGGGAVSLDRGLTLRLVAAFSPWLLAAMMLFFADLTLRYTPDIFIRWRVPDEEEGPETGLRSPARRPPVRIRAAA